jgi:hypothetical protein
MTRASLERLEALKTLKRGWDGEDAPPPSKFALVRAEEALRALEGFELEVDADVLGGVALTGQFGARRAWIAILNEGHDTLTLRGPPTLERFPWGPEAIERLRRLHDAKPKPNDDGSDDAAAWQLIRAAVEAIPTPEDPAVAGSLNKWFRTVRQSLTAHMCRDCNIHPEIFMVQDDLWDQHGVGSRMLCILCFEKRVGRPLTIEDFKPVPCNDLIFWALRHPRPPYASWKR